MKNDEALSLISFTLGEAMFAITANSVREVHLPLPVSPLPFVPECINGLINLNGQIMPQVDLACFLKASSISHHRGGTLMIIDLEGMQLALKVTAMVEPLMVTTDALDHSSEAFEAFDNQYLDPYFYHQEQPFACFQVNALHTLLATQTHQVATDAHVMGHIEPQRTAEENACEYLLMLVAEQLLALEVDTIEKIVDIDKLHCHPLAPEYLMGTALIQGRPVPIISTNQLLGQTLPKLPAGQTSGCSLTVIILNHKHCRLGLAIDQALGLYAVNPSTLIAHGEAHQQGFVRDDVFIPVYGFNTLINTRTQAQLQPYLPMITEHKPIIEPHKSILLVSISAQLFGIDTRQIQRILNGCTLTPLLQEYPGLLGTIDFDGHIIPVIDLAGQMGFSNERPCHEFIIVVHEQQHREQQHREQQHREQQHREQQYWALATHECRDIIRLKESLIDCINSEQRGIIGAFSQHNGQLLQLLDIDNLCNITSQTLSGLADE